MFIVFSLKKFCQNFWKMCHWSQEDKCGSNTTGYRLISVTVHHYLNQTFNERWIGRGSLNAWPPRSPDLSSLDFFLWGHTKTLIYEIPIDTEEDLVARIIAAANHIQNIPEVFERVRQSMFRRCRLCVEVNGGRFEHLL